MMNNRRKLIVIAGATAVGKTDLSVELAKHIGGCIISADSMQVYKGMDIGTAKIKPSEMCGIRHYLIDELDPSEDFNVFEFQKRSKKYIEEIYADGHIPIITGGTGFYIQSVAYDIDFTEEKDDGSYRSMLEKKAYTEGKDVLYEMLKKADPESAQAIHPNNVKRVIRALEYHHDTGQKISEHNKEQSEKTSPFDLRYFVINRKRPEIYERINERVDQMISEGLVDEVRSLLDSGVSPESTSMQGLGYKEIVSYLRGDITLGEAVILLKKNTRHFAKRQITWFKRESDAIWLDFEDYPSKEAMLDHLIEMI